MSNIIEKNFLPSKKSYGDRDLRENFEQASKDIAEVQNALDPIFNRAKSQFVWKSLVFSHYSPIARLRSISAEMTSRQNALYDNYYRHKEMEAKVKRYEKLLEDMEDSDPNFELYTVKLEKARNDLSFNSKYIEGALKDVACIKEAYEKQLELIGGEFDEEKFEQEEARTHLRRSISQCVRDVSQTRNVPHQKGNISKGEQEYLEQLGHRVRISLF